MTLHQQLCFSSVFCWFFFSTWQYNVTIIIVVSRKLVKFQFWVNHSFERIWEIYEEEHTNPTYKLYGAPSIQPDCLLFPTIQLLLKTWRERSCYFQMSQHIAILINPKWINNEKEGQSKKKVTLLFHCIILAPNEPGFSVQSKLHFFLSSFLLSFTGLLSLTIQCSLWTTLAPNIVDTL